MNHCVEPTVSGQVADSLVFTRWESSAPVAIDLFAGPGGLSAGFVAAGFRIAAWVEKNPYACATLRRNHGASGGQISRVIEKQIQAVHKSELDVRLSQLGVTAPDVVIGGPPCQGFSRSNTQSRNRENPLNGLWEHFTKVVSWYRPRLVLIENVDDLRHFARGAVLEEIVAEFDCLGYSVDFETLRASNYGVPQNRNRVVIAATRRGVKFRFPEKTCETPLTVWDAISDLPKVSNGNTVDVLPYSTTRGENDYQRSRRNNRQEVANNLVTRNGDLVLKRYKHIPQGGNWRDIPDELMQNYANKEMTHNWIYRRLREDLPAVTITNFRKSMLIHPKEDRGLSVREAARIQSFHDSYVISGTILHQQQQVADAVPPLFAEALADAARVALSK